MQHEISLFTDRSCGVLRLKARYKLLVLAARELSRKCNGFVPGSTRRMGLRCASHASWPEFSGMSVSRDMRGRPPRSP